MMTKRSKSVMPKSKKSKKTAERVERNGTRESGVNRVRLVGVVASATTSREGTLARRLEIPAIDNKSAREMIDLECEKSEILQAFRGLRVKDWVSLEGRIRRRYWRAGATLLSRTYVEVTQIDPR